MECHQKSNLFANIIEYFNNIIYLQLFSDRTTSLHTEKTAVQYQLNMLIASKNTTSNQHILSENSDLSKHIASKNKKTINSGIER